MVWGSLVHHLYIVLESVEMSARAGAVANKSAIAEINIRMPTPYVFDSPCSLGIRAVAVSSSTALARVSR